MVQELTKPHYQGTPREQELADRVARLMLARGMFMSRNAVMRASIDSLPAFLEKEGVATTVEELASALTANGAIFLLSENDETQLVSMTKDHRAPKSRQQASRHTFAARFLTPLPKPEPTVRAPRPSAQAVDMDILVELEDLPLPVFAPIAEEVIAVQEPEPDPEPPIEAPVAPVARTITTHVATPTDVTDVDDRNLAIAIRDRLGADPRVASFGEQWLMEDRVPRFSRGDLRRLRDYMQEKEQPLTDDDLTQDVLGVRPGSVDFELTRFALNFRLSNEHRDFEFVGTANQRFWSTSGLPQIGTTRRKLTEIGTDYRFLLDQDGPAAVHRSQQSVDHTLTFYEFIHGLLPYDRELQELLPAPLVPGQKSAVLTFECPQSFTTYLVELRYATPNRGGFFLGLDDFYTENLVPGAIISISRTDNDGHYRVEYLPESAKGDQLLELDERRALRYVFRPTTYACGVDDAMVLTEARYSGFTGEKPLDEKVKRRPESVVAATFERIGEERGGNYSAEFTKLLAGVNVERPLSESLLRAILENDDTGAFSRDPEGEDIYTYVPGNTP